MLTRTLADTKAVAADVQRAAEDIAVVGTVLEQALPIQVQVGDVALAIAHATELERKLSESAQKLAEANKALEREVARRVEATQKCDESEARLDKLTQETAELRAAQ